MIIGIEGGLGSGKTILMTRYLLNDFKKGFDVSANYKLKKIKYSPLDVLQILEMEKEHINIKDKSVGIDEITVFMDCRKSSSKMNRLMSYFILQTRKRNVNLYFTTQDFNMVDIRLLKHTEIQILCLKTDREHFRKYVIFDFRDIHNMPKPKRLFLDISKYFDYYDTNEVILPPI